MGDAVSSGIVVIDKPPGLTSHDVVARVRRLAGTRRVGHAGTLDPMATGVLVLGVGTATRLLTYLVGVDKTYTAVIRLGQATSTDDAEGELVTAAGAAGLETSRVQAAVRQLTGEIEQVPSSVSAIKVAGKRAYARVRAGEEVSLAPRTVRVHRFEVLSQTPVTVGDLECRDVAVEVDVSSGTYVRALARDLGAALGVGGHLTELRRTKVGPFGLDRALSLEQASEGLSLLSPAEAAAGVLPVRSVDAREATELGFGRRLAPAGRQPGLTAAVDGTGVLVAIIEETATHAKPVLVFAAN